MGKMAAERFSLPVPWMSSHLWIPVVLVGEIESRTCGLAADAEVLHEPQSAAGAEQVGVKRRRAIGYRFGGDLVEIGEFVRDGLHFTYA